LVLSCGLLVVLLGLWPSLPLGAIARSADELTKEQQDQLQRRAAELKKQAIQLYQQGRYPEATKLYEQILPLYQQLYPKDQFPQGHPDLALSLNNLGYLLKTQADYAGARNSLLQALAMHRALYPKEKYPRGEPTFTNTLNNLGTLLQNQGNYAGARDCFQEALAMCQALYPKEEAPNGHPYLATSLNNLGMLLQAQGDYASARGYLEQAVAMLRTLDATGQCPQDQQSRLHADLATSLNNLGSLLQDQAEYAGARNSLQQALAMRRALYPHGHPYLVSTLNNLGGLQMTQGDYGSARDYFQQALAIGQALYPEALYPHGHPYLVVSLNNQGVLLRDQGDYAAARNSLQQALAMRRALYPKDRYPQGHPDLAQGLCNLGYLLMLQGDYPAARCHSQQALALYQGLAENVMAAMSEAEALNYLASLPFPRDVFLSVSRHFPDRDAACYAPVWRGKGTLFRILRSRQQALLQQTDPESHALWEQLVLTRRGLARLILSPPHDPAAHRKRLQELTEQKEKLERQLAERSAPFRRQQESARATPGDLGRQLPPRSVFIDLLRYRRIEQDPKVPGKKGEQWILCYIAFVLRPGQPPVRVELGEAGPIDAAVAAWRRHLASGSGSAAADAVRRLVWDRLAPHLPSDTRTVLVAPDEALTQLPWAALPGDRPGSVLLEDYAFAVVPNGPFLLDHLTAAPESEPDPGLLLAVGGVHYDHEPRSLPQAKGEQLLAWRPVERGSRPQWSAEGAAAVVAAAGAGPFEVLPFLLMARPSWSYLPGTLREIEAVSKLADPRPVQIRRGTEANTAQLLQDLPQARYALLATHGFFADPQFRSVFLLDEAAFRHQGREGRAAPGARNPLVLSGLVLAGANQQPAGNAEGIPEGDGGILTAEMIASLPLQHLELVVLSACETGLGEVAGGEGVYGLQRAFHMAGAQTTVASLWQVDDDITQELLTRFFENLWHKGLGRLEALRQAQLAVRRGEGNRAQPRYWAAWVLSGDPGDLVSAPVAALPGPPKAVAEWSWWSGWPLYATGAGVFLLAVLGLVAIRSRRIARSRR
jgi:CHAT domain-containing protein/tetratricopeptide (TPR) repeat protein